MSFTDRFVHLFFMDGVGLGGDDPAVNPFVTADTPALTTLFGPEWYLHHLRSDEPLSNERATLVAADPNLGVAGRPQSATGQAAILTGRNVSAAIGEHYGPKPNEAVRQQVGLGSLFGEVVQAGGTAALLSPYPPPYFKAIESGRRLYSTVPLAATNAGLALMTADDLLHGRAVSPGFTNQAWRDMLGYPEMPILSLHAAGQKLVDIARDYTFTFFEHWPSDRLGHRGSLEEAAAHLEMIDGALAGLIEGWHALDSEGANGLLIITSDHGNIEDKSLRQHTTNPVPTIVMGPNHAEWAAQINSLTDIAGVVRQFLRLPA